MRILISGASGLVGSRLTRQRAERGDEVFALVRREPGDREIRWDPAGDRLSADQVSGFDAVVHLAGENIAGRRWSSEQMTRIRDSRVDGTRLLVDRLVAAAARPRLLVSASAIGAYGDRGDETLDEESGFGTGFFADVCRAWEGETDPAREAGIRTVNLRIGIVLDREGGALPKMLLPFRLGLGGRIGSGRQFMSWIALDDLIRAIDRVFDDPELGGPVNAVAPHPVTNRQFTVALGRALSRPTILPVPAFVARLAFGRMADEALLASQRVVPKRLLDRGFEFRWPELHAALAHVLAR